MIGPPVGVLVVVETVKVEDPAPVTEVGLNEHVVPDGQPVTLRPTVPVNPLMAAIDTVELPDEPRVIVKDVGLREIEKSGTAAGLTVSATAVEWTGAPPGPVPVTVSVIGPPVGVLLVVATVKVEDPAPVTEVGLNEHVVPDGQPVTLRPTVPVNPLIAAIDIVEVPDEPGVIVSDVGLLEIEKSGVAAPPHEANLNDAKNVLQLKLPFD